MRIALLEASKRTRTGELRAQLRFGGRSVLAWQVELVRELGCQRIIVLCTSADEQILALQREIEADGGEFHAIRGSLQLTSLVHAEDELVMVRDGLVADRERVNAMFSVNEKLERAIATIPASHALCDAHPDDFERIDRDRHWAGLAVMKAFQVHKLGDLPPDGDTMSLLLRLGLQARVATKNVPADALDGLEWILAVDEGTLTDRETELIEASSISSHWAAPTKALSGSLVRRFAPRGMRLGREISALGAIVATVSGVGLAVLGFAAVGIGIVAAGAFASGLSHNWGDLRRAMWFSGQGQGDRLSRALDAVVDLACATALILAFWHAASPLYEMALPALAIGLARVASAHAQPRAKAFWSDRALHMLGFAVATATGYLGEAVAIFAIAALVQLLLRGDLE